MRPTSIETLNALEVPIWIDLGAGGKSTRPDHISFDILPMDGVDIAGDLNEVLPQVQDDLVSGVYTRHFLEHVDDVGFILREIVRISKEGARIEITVPHFSNPFYYSDVTHRNHFGLYSFLYMAESLVPFRRQVPGYARVEGLVLQKVRLGFWVDRRHPIRGLIKKVVQKLANLNTFTLELYEECFCWLVPCHELTYTLTVRKERKA